LGDRVTDGKIEVNHSGASARRLKLGEGSKTVPIEVSKSGASTARNSTRPPPVATRLKPNLPLEPSFERACRTTVPNRTSVRNLREEPSCGPLVR